MRTEKNTTMKLLLSLITSISLFYSLSSLAQGSNSQPDKRIYVTGIVETAILSTGQSAILQSARDIFYPQNRTILIPKGSRLICDAIPVQHNKLNVYCNRILLASSRVELIDEGRPLLQSTHPIDARSNIPQGKRITLEIVNPYVLKPR